MHNRKEATKINNLELNEEKRMSTNIMNSLRINKNEFDMLMEIYKEALNQVYDILIQIKEKLNGIYGNNVINSISKRIKTPDSIITKMEKKNYELNMKNLIENIDDIAGIRIACPVKSNIYDVINIINEIPNITIVETKDYISKPKKSGYSGYHLIIETPIDIEGQSIPIKVEIQIRTMAMDFWATNEHKMRYKTNKKLSIIDSKRLTAYAKIINIIDDKITEMYNKHELA